MLDKIDDIIYEPIKLATDWAREPLNTRAHKREMESVRNTALAEAEARNLEKDHDAKLHRENSILEADLEVKRKTEVQRILTEIEELKKDKEFDRMKAVSDAIMQYQEHLTRLNVNAISAIGSMQLDLREKAQNLVYEKTVKYKELQDGAHEQAVEEIMRIEEKFANNETAKGILFRSVDIRLANIITTAQNFLIELNNDIAVLNKSINLLTERGQGFIEQHLDKFHVIGTEQFLSADLDPTRRLK